MKKIILLLLSFSISFRLSSDISIENINYRISGSGDLRSMIKLFHPVLSESMNIFDEFNCRKENYTIVFAANADEFYRLTKLNAQTAGAWNINNKTFYFQNPISLKKKGILENTVKHETAHALIDSLYPQASVFNKEAFALAVSSPMYMQKGAFPSSTLSETESRFSNALLKRKGINHFYTLALEWGSYNFSRKNKLFPGYEKSRLENIWKEFISRKR
ncbi:MAG TPA: hypothetical protein PLH15_05080 [Spirochaetota bacterium]|nr:hypothetical protein [Spirochaetota bacterium]